MASKRKTSSAQAAAEREQHLFDLLAGALRQAGHEVTVSKSLEGRGGDCMVKGSPRIIVSRRLPVAERLDVLVDAARKTDLAGVELPDEVRELLAAAPASKA